MFKFLLIIRMIFLMFCNFLMISLFLNAGDFITRVVMLLFLICFEANLFETVFMLFKNDNAIKVCRKIFFISFFAYIFGFFLFWIVYNIINKEYILVLFSIPFILLCVKIIKNRIKNK